MPKTSTKKSKIKPRDDEAEETTPVYSFASFGIPGAGMSIWGYRPRAYVIAKARAHYQRQIDLAQRVLEAIESNQVSVVYKRGGVQISADQARSVQETLDESKQ